MREQGGRAEQGAHVVDDGSGAGAGAAAVADKEIRSAGIVDWSRCVRVSIPRAVLGIVLAPYPKLNYRNLYLSQHGKKNAGECGADERK
jgi:hypothetical protein